MANALYDKGREGFLAGDIDWDANDIRVILLTAAYSPNLATDQFLSIVPGGARVATSGALTGKTVANGVADADDVTYTAVSGSSVTRILIYQHTGNESTARLIALIDTGTGLPFTPSGGDVVVRWSDGADKIFKL